MAAAKSTSASWDRRDSHPLVRPDIDSGANQRGQEEDFQSTISCVPCGAAWEKVIHRAELGENDTVISGDLPYAGIGNFPSGLKTAQTQCPRNPHGCRQEHLALIPFAYSDGANYSVDQKFMSTVIKIHACSQRLIFRSFCFKP